MITLNDVSFGYSKINQLFQRVNLNLQPGSICGLLGKNGAGKTSLLKIMAGLLFAETGDCLRFGLDVKKRTPDSLANIYFVPEEFFVPEMTAKEYVDLYAPFYLHFDINLFESCMREFDISNETLLTALSYGQKKKFLISFAIATQCRILLFDEPTNGLDIPSKSQFRKLISSHITEERLFIISTHQVHDVEKLIDRVVVLEDGRIILNNSMTHIMQKISVEQEIAEPSLTSCIYYEKNMSGYAVITENKSNMETHIDLELFFNMVITNKEKARQLFDGEK